MAGNSGRTRRLWLAAATAVPAGAVIASVVGALFAVTTPAAILPMAAFCALYGAAVAAVAALGAAVAVLLHRTRRLPFAAAFGSLIALALAAVVLGVVQSALWLPFVAVVALIAVPLSGLGTRLALYEPSATPEVSADTPHA
ncbi:hypothetical protein [Leifsonia sp. NPDC080035]|uniref:Integral membrane protein n=1 Tax=Leifsonia sp. NPDC080035 TaxID=3143936 RepID=A0AAU7GH55_9MICO